MGIVTTQRAYSEGSLVTREMAEPLKVLLLEDNEDDAELVKLTLCRAGLDVQWLWAGGEEAFRQALGTELDLILADYSLPHFNARQALLILREQRLDLPRIVITGSSEEDSA